MPISTTLLALYALRLDFLETLPDCNLPYRIFSIPNLRFLLDDEFVSLFSVCSLDPPCVAVLSNDVP